MTKMQTAAHVKNEMTELQLKYCETELLTVAIN